LLLRSQQVIYTLAPRRLLAVTYAVAGVLIITGLWYGPFVQLGVEVFGVIVSINLIGLLARPFPDGFRRLGRNMWKISASERKPPLLLSQSTLSIHDSLKHV